MKIVYDVHSSTAQPFDTKATLSDGREVSATVQGVVAELVSKDGTMTHTLKFIPESIEDALAALPVGAEITATFEKTADPPVVEAPTEEAVVDQLVEGSATGAGDQPTV